MNWPPLSEGLTTALSEVLEQAYQQKPGGGLLEFVADELQQRSGWDAAAYQAEFEKAGKVVRTYKLEDECPATADPYAWIRKRYNDEAILSFLRLRGAEAARKAKAGDNAGVVADLSKYVPELAYIRNSPEKKKWFDTYTKVVLALLATTGAGNHPAAPIVQAARGVLEDSVAAGGPELDFEEALAVGVMRVLMDLPDVRKHQKTDGIATPFSAFEAVPAQYPTLFRGPALLDRLKAVASLPDVIAPMLNGELLPAQLLRLKEAGGVDALVCYQAATFLADQSIGPGLSPKQIAAAARVVAAVAEVATKTVHVINSQYLERTANDAEFPFVVGAAQGDRNPLQCRSVLRLSLLTGLINEKEGCFKVEEVFNAMSQSEKQTLQRELCKDGVLQYPAFQFVGAHQWISKAAAKGQLPNALQLLASVFQEVNSEVAGATLREPNVTVDMSSLVAVAASLAPGAATIDSTAVTLDRSGNHFTLRAHRI